MIEYRYLMPGQCANMYPVIYHDAQQTDKSSKYLVLHEVYSRWNNNWFGGKQWMQYKGVITWNPLIYEEHKESYNMIYCDQYMNIGTENVKHIIAFEERQKFLCAIYGPPASIDEPIMMARYDVPLGIYDINKSVNAYGAVPDVKRPEYRKQWLDIFRGPLPYRQKWSALINHKFSMAFENSRDPYWASGWVTEKIYHCLACGTIPIYWGAPNVSDYIPPEVFIDYRDFSGPVDLHSYLTKTEESVFSKMSKDGIDFFNTVKFDKYLDIFEAL